MTDVIYGPRVESALSDAEAVMTDVYARFRPSADYSAGGQWVLAEWPDETIPINGAAVTLKLDPLPTVPYEMELYRDGADGIGVLIRHEYRIVPSSGSPVTWESCTKVTGPMGDTTPTDTVQAALDTLFALVGGVSGGATNLAGITDMSAFMRTVNDDTTAAAARTTLGAAAIGTTSGTAADATTVVTLTGNQTVAGVKTLTSIPQIPTTTPTLAAEVASKSYVDSVSTTGTVADATTSLKGKVQLAGDLAGTAAAPTVPALTTINATLTSLAASITSLNTTVAALKAGWVVNRAVAGVYPARPVTAAAQPVLWVGPTQPTTGGTVSSATGAVNGLDFYGILA